MCLSDKMIAFLHMIVILSTTNIGNAKAASIQCTFKRIQ